MSTGNRGYRKRGRRCQRSEGERHVGCAEGAGRATWTTQEAGAGGRGAGKGSWREQQAERSPHIACRASQLPHHRSGPQPALALLLPAHAAPLTSHPASRHRHSPPIKPPNFLHFASPMSPLSPFAPPPPSLPWGLAITLPLGHHFSPCRCFSSPSL